MGLCAQQHEYNRTEFVRILLVPIHGIETALNVMAVETISQPVPHADVYHRPPLSFIFFFGMAFLL